MPVTFSMGLSGVGELWAGKGSAEKGGRKSNPYAPAIGRRHLFSIDLDVGSRGFDADARLIDLHVHSGGVHLDVAACRRRRGGGRRSWMAAAKEQGGEQSTSQEL